ncbi:hypothetical protein B0H17DRAFT_918613, partial [Mycena rosella]
APDDLIFYLEVFCVAWCLDLITDLVCANGTVVVCRIMIWTDNKNTFDIFNSLRMKPLYNEILKYAVNILINNNFKLHVLLLSGKKNVVANALSHWHNNVATNTHPGL